MRVPLADQCVKTGTEIATQLTLQPPLIRLLQARDGEGGQHGSMDKDALEDYLSLDATVSATGGLLLGAVAPAR